MNHNPPQRPRLSAFGSSRISSNEDIYKDVSQLSRMLAQDGWNGMVGGHQGMMAAFSEGMLAGGGHIRGITLECFPTPSPNTLSEELRAKNFFDRMRILIEEADAWLILPGGLGTLAELAMTWDLLAIHILQPRPMILYGEMWPTIIDTLASQLVFSSEHPFESLHICQNHHDVRKALKDSPHVQ